MSNEEPDPNGKTLWDVVALRLAAQAANQTALTGRAKDLLGAATIAGTIIGVVYNDKLFPLAGFHAPGWWIPAVVVTYLGVVLCAVSAVWPRSYSFSPDAADFADLERDNPGASANMLYRAAARGFLDPLSVKGKTQIQVNEDRLRTLERLVRGEIVSLGGLAGLALYLAAFARG